MFKKKYIIGLSSGLGNQLYQYLLFLYLKNNGYNCSVCTLKHYLNEHNGLELLRIFPQTHKYVDIRRNFVDDFIIWFHFFISNTYLNLCISIFKKHFPRLYNIVDRLTLFKVVVFPQWDNYIFIDKIPSYKENFIFPKLEGRNAEIMKMMTQMNSISIHVRRGDYQDNFRWWVNLGDICGTDYYNNAIQYAAKLYEDPIFFVFSDDINWVRENLDIPERKVMIDWNIGQESFRDMQLMTYCKCNICANSTFSLISAWFNTNEQSIKIVPSKWVSINNNLMYEKYVCKDNAEWIVIDNNKPRISIISNNKLTKNDYLYLLRQNYVDYEAIVPEIDPIIYDKRIRLNSHPKGLLVLEINDFSVMKDPNFLYKWLSHSFLDQKNN